ncbi:MAG: bifunctional 5,10-methylene-tetrahydrofolate dehydrogenase/5,10-methylene-tetrahydrofolate cyclohydrolase [Candidatus Bipolaricaulota bacterium]|nr:bifunctional 5,10-methylene-tetrahydrofolate dehydrogenase/5,10-methylene-tetrahydrofolate cyclohydrolase [Candidatus Bipolaricaulota bacterium]MDW8126355.1 tetrahydrofolate dehydrogenase/cyclohydrolase catalytic domain-containing protein [Candidatus Bipolaricaulota bacterium]
MAAKIISGQKIADAILLELGDRFHRLKKIGITPGLAMVRVGEDPASISYMNRKEEVARSLGIHTKSVVLPEKTPESLVLKEIQKLNSDPNIHGIIIQQPLPPHLNPARLVTALDPLKDVDCFHPVNVGKLLLGEPYLLPCTPHGIWQLLLRSGYSPEGKHVVICGRSNIVGKPLLALLIQKKAGANATVTVCHTGTPDLSYFTRQAEILITAMGAPHAITADMVRAGAVVIDVGVNRVPDPTKKTGFRLVGDTDFHALLDKVEAITPVPGGVGPMTVAMLMWNTVLACEAQAGLVQPNRMP